MDSVWRCTACGKVKDLSGPHLNGKATVRSDCWPCAKKQTFQREPAGHHSTAASSVAAPPDAPAAVKSGMTGASPIRAAQSPPLSSASAPFLYTTTAASGTPPSAHKSAIRNPFLGKDTAASVGSFSSAFTFVNTGTNVKLPFAGGAAPSRAVTGAGSGGNPFLSHAAAAPAPLRSPQIVMEKREGNSPAFTFKAVPPFPAVDASFADPNNMLPSSTGSSGAGGVGSGIASAAPGWPSRGTDLTRTPAGRTSAATAAAAPSHASVAASLSPPSPDFVWMCSECRKTKELSGPHLKGKTSVRSDCWPCGKKRLFILVNRAELSRRSPSSSALRPHAAAGAISPMGKAHTAVSSPPSTRTTEAVCAQESPPQVSSVPTAFSSIAASAPPLLPSLGSASAPVTQQQHEPAATPEHHVRSAWCVPVIPPNEAVTGFYLFPESDGDDLTHEAVFCTAGDGGATSLGVGAGGPTTVAITASQRMQALFNAQLLHSYRLRIVEGVPLRAVWHGSVLYVIAEEPPASTVRLLSGSRDHSGPSAASSSALAMASSATITTATASTATADAAAVSGAESRQHRLLQEGNKAYDMMGRFAALLMAVESKLATSRFRRMRRLFCSSAFSFAASCCYASQFVSFHAATAVSAGEAVMGGAESRSPGVVTVPFTVYGPSPDITTAPTLWHRVIDSCPLAEPCVVSDEQRIRAAQQLYRRVSWLAMPADMSAAAIQLMKEEADKKHTSHADGDEHGGASMSEFSDGVDVVLLPGTMRLEELPAAAVLALPVKQF